MSKQVSWDAVVRALETCERDAQRRRRLVVLGWWLLLAALSCGFGALLYQSVKDLENAWGNGDPLQWDRFWQLAFALLALSPLAIFSRFHALGALLRPLQDSLSIRQEVVDGKIESAPIAAEQPLVLPDDLVGRQNEIGPLSRPHAGEREAAITGATVLITVSLILAPFSLVLVILPVSGVASRIAGLGLVAITHDAKRRCLPVVGESARARLALSISSLRPPRSLR